MSQIPSRNAGHYLSLTNLTLVLFGACALVYAISPQGRPQPDMLRWAETTRVALNVALRGAFADPFQAMPTGPTAHPAPAYVLLFAFVARLFGTGRAGAIVLWALNLVCLALQLALLPVLSKRLGLGIRAGLVAAVLGAIVQPYRIFIQWESIVTGALLVALCVLTFTYFQSPRDWRHSALLGLLWGAAILTCPQSVLLMLVWPHIAAGENAREDLTKARRAMLVVVAGVAFACMPWFIRNYETFHSVFFVRDNFGLELYVSNNPCAQPTVLGNIESGCHKQTHPNANPEVAGEILDKGEVEFNRDRLRRALSWIEANPRAFAELTARRFVRFWFPHFGSYRYAIPMGVLTVLSFAGLILMYREHRTAARLLGSTLLFYPLVHYLVQFEARYRYPILWATLLPAAYALVKIADRLRSASRNKASVGCEADELIAV